MKEEHTMKTMKLNAALPKVKMDKPEPAVREITMGLQREIENMIKDPLKIAVSCCIEGCCVSWCCIQIS